MTTEIICPFCGEKVEPDWEENGDGSEAFGYCPECKNDNHWQIPNTAKKDAEGVMK